MQKNNPIDSCLTFKKTKHPGEMPQLEALLEEGFYKMKGEAKAYLENGLKKVEVVDGIEVPWVIVELEELGSGLRKIN